MPKTVSFQGFSSTQFDRELSGHITAITTGLSNTDDWQVRTSALLSLQSVALGLVGDVSRLEMLVAGIRENMQDLVHYTSPRLIHLSY